MVNWLRYLNQDEPLVEFIFSIELEHSLRRRARSGEKIKDYGIGILPRSTNTMFDERGRLRKREGFPIAKELFDLRCAFLCPWAIQDRGQLGSTLCSGVIEEILFIPYGPFAAVAPNDEIIVGERSFNLVS